MVWYWRYPQISFLAPAKLRQLVQPLPCNLSDKVNGSAKERIKRETKRKQASGIYPRCLARLGTNHDSLVALSAFGGVWLDITECGLASKLAFNVVLRG